MKYLIVIILLTTYTIQAKDQVRVSASLIDGQSGRQIWSNRWDRKITDIFDLQDELSRAIVSQLLTDWVGRSTALLEPLADHIGKLVRAGPALFADDTPVKLQTRTKIKKTQTARLWSYVRDERPWCGDALPCAWYQFSVDRKGEHPVNHLSGYTGTVHAPSRQIASQSPAGQWTAMPGSITARQVMLCITERGSLRRR